MDRNVKARLGTKLGFGLLPALIAGSSWFAAPVGAEPLRTEQTSASLPVLTPRPEVKILLRAAQEGYRKLQSYQHTEVVVPSSALSRTEMLVMEVLETAKPVVSPTQYAALRDNLRTEIGHTFQSIPTSAQRLALVQRIGDVARKAFTGATKRQRATLERTLSESIGDLSGTVDEQAESVLYALDRSGKFCVKPSLLRSSDDYRVDYACAGDGQAITITRYDLPETIHTKSGVTLQASLEKVYATANFVDLPELLIASLFDGTATADSKTFTSRCLAAAVILPDASEAGQVSHVLRVPTEQNTFDIYFDPTTNRVRKWLVRRRDMAISLSITLSEVQTDKPQPAAFFTLTSLAEAKTVAQFTHTLEFLTENLENTLAPDFTMRDQKNKSFVLSGQRGKIVVLIFLTLSDETMRALLAVAQELNTSLASQGAAFVVVDTWDTFDGFDLYKKRHPETTLPLLADPAQKLKSVSLAVRQYGLTEVPLAVVIGRDGRITQFVKGTLGNIRTAFPRMMLLDALSELLPAPPQEQPRKR